MNNILVVGSRGMVGSAIVRQLEKSKNNITELTRDKLDLLNQREVFDYLKDNSFDEIYIAAARVGGIFANDTYPANFIYENLMIECNLIHGSFLSGIKKLLFLGSSCIYPKFANQPMNESALLSGKLESTNEPYAIAKIAGIKLCESYNRQYQQTHQIDYRSVMPTNLYGPGDNYHPDNSHVIPALIRRFHEAKINKSKEVLVWGSGRPMREFLYVDDMAKASIFVMNLDKEYLHKKVKPMQSHINVGFGSDLSIRDLSLIVSEVIGYDGRVNFDKTKPDGSPRKLLDSELLMSFGWKPEINLETGIALAYKDFLNFESRR